MLTSPCLDWETSCVSLSGTQVLSTQCRQHNAVGCSMDEVTQRSYRVTSMPRIQCPPRDELSLFGVFDGHGGAEVGCFRASK